MAAPLGPILAAFLENVFTDLQFLKTGGCASLIAVSHQANLLIENSTQNNKSITSLQSFLNITSSYFATNTHIIMADSKMFPLPI